MVRQNNEKALRIVVNFILGLYFTISMISISVLATLNFTPVYRLIINKYDLTLKTGLSNGQLVENYRILINYLQNPFIKKLELKNFIMSTNGEIHFQEVKNIFIIVMIISVTFILLMLWYLILYKRGKINSNILDIFNYSSNILIIFFISLITTFFIDFSWIFEVFHKIFFRNDYWIFDPELDPIIIALPEELFMFSAIIILSVLIIIAMTIKTLDYKSRIKEELKVKSFN